MIQFNLLPSVKLEYVRAKRTKRLTLLGAATVAGGSLLILVLLFANVQLQAKHSNDLSKDIASEASALENTEDLSTVLTVQNQLGSLAMLHGSKPEAARSIAYLKQVTPARVTISEAEFDFEQNTISIRGKAPSLAAVNAYADTLKFTTYQTSGEEPAEGKAFSEVVLGAVSPDTEGGSASYELTLKYDPVIFSNASGVKLSIPNQVTTRSQVDSVFSPKEEDE